LDVFDVAHLVDYFHDGWGQLFGAIGLDEGDRDIRLDTTELVQKVNVEIGATKLTVGDALEAHVLLEFHNLGDGLVFNDA
jgi:hypothetical protein